ncbi:hypothetical protein HY972_02645 [Candidatus Kaiserbacteria bacterium]|nr:hypothetical protein [Candidatus Kaiserbacteria bacterium]
MTALLNKRILLSLGVIVFVVAATLGATGAFFSDTETSTGNTFTAGAIDLKVDNESYYNGVLNQDTTWELKDLTIEKFFNFLDLKPGDRGEDTISLHVNNNDAYVCADVKLTSNDDNGITEPERQDGDVSDGAGNGELAQAVNFMWWADDGDNVLENNETPLPSGTLASASATSSVALADSQTNIWTDEGGPLPGGSERFIGKAWCFGAISAAPLEQDGMGTTSPRTPANSTGGIVCNGSQVNNITQTDSLTADVSFRAVQSRNNPGFLCSPRSA